MTSILESLGSLGNNSQGLFFSTLPKAKTNFYCHYNTATEEIIAISPMKSSEDNIENIPVSEKIATDLITGRDNLNLWFVVKNENSYKMIHTDTIEKERVDRLQSLSIVEIVEDVPYPDVRVEIGNIDHPGKILVYYNGESIYNWKNPIKLYLTRENDLTHLKCAIEISSTILDEIIRDNNFEEWPNPLIISVPDADDISVYTIRSNQKIAIRRHYS